MAPSEDLGAPCGDFPESISTGERRGHYAIRIDALPLDIPLATDSKYDANPCQTAASNQYYRTDRWPMAYPNAKKLTSLTHVAPA